MIETIRIYEKLNRQLSRKLTSLKITASESLSLDEKLEKQKIFGSLI